MYEINNRAIVMLLQDDPIKDMIKYCFKHKQSLCEDCEKDHKDHTDKIKSIDTTNNMFINL